MADQIIHEMIAAFAAGCMDKQNFVQFKEYIEHEGEVPEGEMGELQNIVSMIPIILDLEKPHTSIKDKVAKKLIGMKDEIKAKMYTERKTIAGIQSQTSIDSNKGRHINFEGETKINQFKNTFETKFTNPPNNVTSVRKDDFAEYLEKRKTRLKEDTFAPSPLPSVSEKNSVIKEPELQPNINSKSEPESQDAKSASWVGTLAIIITILLFTLLGYYVFTTTEKLNDKLSDVQSEINSLRSQISSANNFVENYSALVEFFNYKDISVTNLNSTNDSLKSSAKLLLSFVQKEGLIQFKNPQQLPAGSVYQLWVIRKGQAFSLGAFQPMGNEYLRITSFSPIPKEQIESYRITVEATGGATYPSGKMVFISELGKNK